MKTMKTALAMAIVSFGAMGTAANAQIEEVVVTAQKKSESLQDTPIAISAFTSNSGVVCSHEPYRSAAWSSLCKRLFITIVRWSSDSHGM